MPGVTIGEGAVVGSNAFVNKDLEPWGIYVGTPVHKVGERRKPSDDLWEKIRKIDWKMSYL